MSSLLKGRGSQTNLANRFETKSLELTEENQLLNTKTQFLPDHSKTILSYNQSPDVPFNVGLNPYRGCEHGCIYCYARPSHEYLGFSSGLEFESKIMVKLDAAQLLRKEMSAKKWQPQVVALSGNTDCYQPIEKKLQLTRQCLEVFAEFRNPVAMITKNRLITRDLDLIQELASFNAASVFISLTSLNTKLIRHLEPRASFPQDRLKTIEVLAQANIPVGVLIAPVIPALNDMEIPAILKAAAEAGAREAGYILLRLPYGVKDLFSQWLEQHYPERKSKILNRLQSIRGTKLNDPRFGMRMKGQGIFVETIEKVFRLHCDKLGLNHTKQRLTTEYFKKPQTQLSLFQS